MLRRILALAAITYILSGCAAVGTGNDDPIRSSSPYECNRNGTLEERDAC